jgi:tryptophan synthase alpha chain
MITARAEGFLYLVSRPGITGARDRLPDGLGDYVSRVRRHTHLPLALGFGISTPAQVQQVAALVDGAIVGSAIVEKAAQGAEAVAAFIDGLCKACRREHSPSLPRS